MLLTGSAPGIRNPVLFSRTQLEYRTAPPVLGQDTAAVLKSMLDMTDSELTALRAAGVVQLKRCQRVKTSIELGLYSLFFNA